MNFGFVMRAGSKARQVGRSGAARRRPVLLPQSDNAECGLACLGMVAACHGLELGLVELRRRFPTSANGTTLLQLIEYASALGFQARPVRAEPEALGRMRLPAILHWDLNHFVVLTRIDRDAMSVLDPARGELRLSPREFGRHFTGIALELRPAPDFEPMRTRGRPSLLAMARGIRGLGAAGMQLVALALVVEVTALLLPLQLQIEIDHALPERDGSLVVKIVVAMLAILALQAVASLARAWAIGTLGAMLNANWVVNLFGHLLKLPMDYFKRRHVGDIVSRFYSVRQIQAKLTGGTVEAVLDGFMSVGALTLMILYAPDLAMITVAAFLLYIAIRQGLYRMLWRINESQVLFSSRQQSEFMDAIRGIQALKLANQQGHRLARLANITFEGARLDAKSESVGLALNTLNRTLFGLQRIFVMGLGAWLIMTDRFSLGMLVAFVTYADQFSQRGAELVDKLIEVRLLRTHVDRIADIALTQPEPEPEPCPTALPATELAASITLRGLGFRYGPDEPWILRGLDLDIAEGEAVAITGSSGCGKSTLARLLLGLLEPTEGEIRIGGVPLSQIGHYRLREMAAAVMQDDTLFSGTIAENISFFAAQDEECMEHVVAAARSAGIHDTIVAMPMGYDTLIGDQGTTLSGGQRQRVVLARALFRQPRILVLDEATSHLDTGAEALVNEQVGRLRITRLIIAHRPETIASASRRIDLDRLAAVAPCGPELDQSSNPETAGSYA